MKFKQLNKWQHLALGFVIFGAIAAIADCNYYSTPSSTCGTPKTPTCPNCIEVDCPTSWTCNSTSYGSYLLCYQSNTTNHCEQWEGACAPYPPNSGCEEDTDDGSTGNETCTTVSTLSCGG